MVDQGVDYYRIIWIQYNRLYNTSGVIKNYYYYRIVNRWLFIGMRIMMMIIENWLPWNTREYDYSHQWNGLEWNLLFSDKPSKKEMRRMIEHMPSMPSMPCGKSNNKLYHHRPIPPWPIFDPILGPIFFLDSVTPQWSRKSGTPTPLRCRSPERNRTTTLVSHGCQGRQLHCTGHSPAANGISRIYIWI